MCLSLATSIGLALPSSGTAQESRASFRKQTDVPAQRLETALRSLASERDFQIVFVHEDLEGLETSGTSGQLTTEEAITRLLDGTELVYRYLDENTITITPRGDSARVTAAPRPGEPRSTTDTGPDEKKSTSSSLRESSMRTRFNTLKTALISVLIGTGSASAQEPANTRPRTIEEVVVTAEKRAESIQELPIAVSAFSAELLEERGIASIETLQQLAPSLSVSNLARGFGTDVTMRGISGTADRGVGIVQDGVPYFTSNMAAVDIFDIERVEVLRGPQGTMSGRNTTGGALYFHSKRPTEETEAGFKATLGNYDRVAIEGYASGPLAKDRLLGRLAVRSDRADGWVTNTLLGEKLGEIDQLQARATLLGHVTKKLEATLIMDVLRDRSSTVSIDGPRVRPDMQTLPELAGVPAFDRDARTLQQDMPGGVDFEKYQTTLNLGWDLGDWLPSARLTSITGYGAMDITSSQDHNDATAAPALVWGPPTGTPLHQEVWQWTQELTLTADLTDRLDMIVGSLYLRGAQSEEVQYGVPLLGLPAGSLYSFWENDLTSWAGYTQWRYRLTDDIRLTAGARYTRDTKERFERTTAFGTGGPPTTRRGTWEAWTPRFAVDYSPTDDLTIYASISRGFSSGGFSFSENLFDEEIVTSYELGLKTMALDGRLRTALTGFYMDYTDLQIVVIGVSDDPAADVLGRTVTNADAPIYGVELELEALLTDRLRVMTSATWLDATLEGYVDHDPLFPEVGVPGPVGLNIQDFSGNHLPRAPEFGFNVTGEYRVPLGFAGGRIEGVLNASYFWRDKEYFNVFNHEALSQDAYGLLHLSAGIESTDGAWSLTGYVYNVADKFYMTQVGGPLALAPPIQFSSARVGPPRTYGVSLAHRF